MIQTPTQQIPTQQTPTQQIPQQKLSPYYHGFKGTVVEVSADKYLIRGTYSVISDTVIRISELPIGMWTDTAKNILTELCDTSRKDKDGKSIPTFIKDFTENHTDTIVNFTVEFIAGKIEELLAQVDPKTGINGIEKLLKLTTTVSTTNMHMFDSKGRLRKYNHVNEILDEFIEVRLHTYMERKAYQIKQLEHDLIILSNRARYILALLDGELDLRKKTKADIYRILTTMGFDSMIHVDSEEGVDSETTVSYEYLLKMRMDSVSKEKADKIIMERTLAIQQLSELKETTVQTMWSRDLTNFMTEYDKYVVELNETNSTVVKEKVVKKSANANEKTNANEKKKKIVKG